MDLKTTNTATIIYFFNNVYYLSLQSGHLYLNFSTLHIEQYEGDIFALLLVFSSFNSLSLSFDVLI